ncbi:outer membrane protein [Legionella gresilensis]|uniref:outer membrane protein n=1 Tax=Legionella gresilensis TaxID=91823 RepID=UPI001041813B|nr:outer membrane beta-barrel protein [Legionella gresilensis]
MKKIALFTTALFITGATSASTVVDSWYVSAFGGYTYLPSNIKTHYYGYLFSDVHYLNGYDVGGSIGYQCNPLRYEFQYTYLNADNDRYSVDHKKELNIDGGTKANVLMTNLYYDFPEMLNSINPFLGVGIGYAFMHATLNSTSRYALPHFNTNVNSFAYQGMGGLSYSFTEKFAINAAYRYMATTNTGKWGKTLQAQMGNVAAVYRF